MFGTYLAHGHFFSPLTQYIQIKPELPSEDNKTIVISKTSDSTDTMERESI